MRVDIKGSKTEKNLMDAFTGEATACTKYMFYAGKARKDGYVQIADFFEETSHNEQEHAKIWFKYLHNNQIGPTTVNLLDAAGGEKYEWEEMYRNFADDARAEGFAEIAALFEMVGAIEKEHEARYRKLLANIEQKQVFARPEKQVWICSNCGHIHEGAGAPDLCPVCSHPQAYFELHAMNY